VMIRDLKVVRGKGKENERYIRRNVQRFNL
jgi:hypothetical protein